MDLDLTFTSMVCCHQLRSNPEAYEGYVPMQYEDYLERMSEYLSNSFPILALLMLIFSLRMPDVRLSFE